MLGHGTEAVFNCCASVSCQIRFGAVHVYPLMRPALQAHLRQSVVPVHVDKEMAVRPPSAVHGLCGGVSHQRQSHANTPSTAPCRDLGKWHGGQCPMTQPSPLATLPGCYT